MDKSDENDCEVVLLNPDTYRKLYPPIGKDVGESLNVSVSMDIITLGEFREIEFTYKIKFKINVQWSDKRLIFQNLKNDTDRNIIGNDKMLRLWTPPLVFNNSEKTTMLKLERPVEEPTVSMFVKKVGGAEIAPPNYLDESYLYKGSENPLLMVAIYNLKVHCVYDFASYPFDHQHCETEVNLF